MERYVLPVDKPTQLEQCGFLALPSVERSDRQEDAVPRLVADLSSDGVSFVLLAAGGVGKTTVLDWVCCQEAGAMNVELLGLDLRGIRDVLQKAARTGSAVHVDAIDEVLRLQPAAVYVLKQVLTDEQARGTVWRLGCRPASWPSVLATALREVGFRELRLLPLTRTAAHDVVADLVPNPSRFIEAVVEANLGRLSASPLQLRAAAKQWHEEGRLPTSHVESINFEIRGLLTEGNPSKKPDVPADRRYRLAGRLGAISIFCGIGSYSRNPTDVPRALKVDDLPSPPEGDEPATPVTPDDYMAVLGTALFETAPHTTVAFRHQQYAEYLAAEYLYRRGATRLQVTQLLGISDGVIPGPMIGVAAWLAAVAPELVNDHIAANPAAFVAAGVELPDQTRGDVVKGLMTKAAAGDIDPEWGLDLAGLTYPGLEDQLRQYLAAGLQEPVEVWWLSRLAHAGRCRGLANELVSLAIDPRWYAWARRATIAAIKDLGDADDCLQLSALLRLDVQHDPDDELLAGAIDTLYPGLMSTDELLAVLRPQRNTHMVGAYRLLLGELADRIPLPDLPPMLAWAAEQAGEGRIGRKYGHLAGQLATRGWDQAHLPAVRDALAALLVALNGASSRNLGIHRESLPWAERPDVERRRQLAIATAARSGDSWYRPMLLGLLVDADLDWILEELPELPPEAQQPIAECVSNMVARMLDGPDAAQIDGVLSLTPSHPAYKTTRTWRDSIALDSELASQQRRSWHAQEQAREANIAVERNWRAALTNSIRQSTDDAAQWWQIAYVLAGPEETTTDKIFSHDLTTRPGWSHLNTDEQQRVLDLGLKYLAEHIPQPSGSLGRKRIGPAPSDTALPDWSGAYLLTTLTRHNPSVVTGLPPATWEAWAPAIVGAWNFDVDDDERLRCDLVDLAPTQARDRILDFALEHLDLLATTDESLSPRPLYEHLCKELAPRLTPRLVAGHYGDHLGMDVLDILAEQDPSTARDLCRALATGSALHIAAYRKLAELDPAGTVDSLGSRETTNDEVAATASRIGLDALDDARLAAICRLLLDRFPFESDPPLEEGFRPDGDAYEVRQARNKALELLCERGAISMLEDLSSNRPDNDRRVIGRFIRAAQTKAADLRLVHPSPDDFLDLVSRVDSRLLRHSDELLAVILEQLTEVQHRIRAGRYVYLWDLPRNEEPRPKPEDAITDWVRDELQNRMGRSSTLHREVQVQRRETGGIGTRIDLTVTSATATAPANTVSVIIEAKLINNASLRTAMTDQLVRRYLDPSGLRHGIYLIYWVDPAQRPSNWTYRDLPNQAGLLHELEQQAASHREQRTIVPFMLDLSRHAQ